jgi:NodT family efflux transporter outer membrane factor (OMF) lipoprotein
MTNFADQPLRERRNPALRLAGLYSAGGSTALAGLLAISGCKVGPDYQTPEATVNEVWQGSASSGDAARANVCWWESFEDPALTALVQDASTQNLTLKQAGLRVLEARAALGISVGQFFPQTQQAVAGIQANQLSLNDAGTAGNDRSFSNSGIGLQAAWELDFWGKFRRGIEAADATVQFTVADYDAVLVSLAASVASTYIQIRSLEERLMFTRANVELQSATLSLTETRFRLGAVSELDVSTARSTLANTHALIPDQENALRQAKLALCVLLGRTPSDLDAELSLPSGAAPHVPDAPPQIAAGVPADLLRRRPDVRAAERAAAAQSARIGQAVADLYPSISIVGATGFVSSTYTGNVQPSLGNMFDANSFAGFIGLQVNWPVLNYGRIRGNIRVQDARFEQAVAAYQESVLRAAGEVEGGLSEFLRSKERAAYLAEAVEASKRSAELSLIQYRAGAVDFIRVNNAQTDLVQQQDNLVVARASIALGAVKTFRALGGGWEIRQGQEFVDPQTIERLRSTTDWGDVLSPTWEKGKTLGFPRPKDIEPSPESLGENK